MEKEFESSGQLTCNKTILYSIVSLATKEISGVVGLSRKTNNQFTQMFQKKDFNGIKIAYNAAGQLIIDVFINVYSNTSAPDLCFKVQENIRNSIISMVDVKPEKVNVHIVDVVVKEEGVEDEIRN